MAAQQSSSNDTNQTVSSDAPSQQASNSSNSSDENNIFQESDESKGNSLHDCDSNCNNNGVCRSYVCYCEPEFTGRSCQISVTEVFTLGIPLHEAIYYLYGGLALGLIFGITIVRYFLQKNKEKEYMKFS